MTRDGCAAKQTNQCPFFVGEINRFEIHIEFDPIFFNCSQHFERGDDSQCAVESSAVGDGVEMGTQ